MPRVDVHQHLWPPSFREALARRDEPPRLTAGGRRLELREGTFDVDPAEDDLDRRLALLDRIGIDVAVVSPAPTLETEEHDDLREAYHAGIPDVAAASNGRIAPLAAGEVRSGFAGACVSAAAFVSGVEPLLEGLASAGGFLFVHPGPPEPRPDSPPWWSAVVDYTAQMQAAFAAWVDRPAVAEVPVVFAILGGGVPAQLERLRARGVDVDAVLERTFFLDTASYGPEAVGLCLRSFGVEHVVFGSDAPVIDPGPTLAAVRSLGDDDFETILSTNGTRLLGRGPQTAAGAR